MKYRKPRTLEEHIASQEQILHKPWAIFYLAAFYNLDTSELDFCKYGVTSENSAMLRFRNHKWPDRTYQYRHWRIEIICEVKMPPRAALECEWYAQQRYKKDVWVDEYFKGAGEIFKFPVAVPDFFNKNIKRFDQLKAQWSEFNTQ